MTAVYLNRIATAVPDHDIHANFVRIAPAMLHDERRLAVFKRMAARAKIEHRYSVLAPGTAQERFDAQGLYTLGAFPDTRTRMGLFEDQAFALARRALDRLDLASVKDRVSHLILTTCTGLYAPGVDFQVMRHYGLAESTERTVIGFMGCYAALNALKAARHFVRSDPQALVLVLNLELCTLHLQETSDLETLLSFLVFADGCAASLVSAEPTGIELLSFRSTVLPASEEYITWRIGGSGFDMVLSGQIPASIASGLPPGLEAILEGGRAEDIAHWAIHPGGRIILDAVQKALGLPDRLMESSRRILRDFGNMSSATIMFVLKDLMERASAPGPGCAMAFGPGVTVESLLFHLPQAGSSASAAPSPK